MNSFNGNSVTAEVETGEGISQNQLTGFDPRQWHEFWITIQADITNKGTHVVRIWMDGDTSDPCEFTVTAGDKDEYDFNGYLVMALVSDVPTSTASTRSIWLIMPYWPGTGLRYG